MLIMKTADDGREVFDREANIQFLLERDGPGCQFPGCSHPFRPEYGSPWKMTIDHIYPQSVARREGWSWEEIWDTDNLAVLHRICNQRKDNAIYGPDGTLEIVEVTRRVKIVRQDICPLCYAGRLLFKGETCESCGLEPQPTTAPAYMQKEPQECSHDRHSHCRMCWVGFIERIEPLEL